MSIYEFGETPETFEADRFASWALYGHVFITNAAGWARPTVIDPRRITVDAQPKRNPDPA